MLKTKSDLEPGDVIAVAYNGLVAARVDRVTATRVYVEVWENFGRLAGVGGPRFLIPWINGSACSGYYADCHDIEDLQKFAIISPADIRLAEAAFVVATAAVEEAELILRAAKENRREKVLEALGIAADATDEAAR